MKVLQTPTFAKQVKKLHKNQQADLNEAIHCILADPTIGDLKKGDLAGVRVYKFDMVHQLMLLAFEVDALDECIILLALGSHENFYRDLKKK